MGLENSIPVNNINNIKNNNDNLKKIAHEMFLAVGDDVENIIENENIKEFFSFLKSKNLNNIGIFFDSIRNFGYMTKMVNVGGVDDLIEVCNDMFNILKSDDKYYEFFVNKYKDFLNLLENIGVDIDYEEDIIRYKGNSEIFDIVLSFCYWLTSLNRTLAFSYRNVHNDDKFIFKFKKPNFLRNYSNFSDELKDICLINNDKIGIYEYIDILYIIDYFAISNIDFTKNNILIDQLYNLFNKKLSLPKIIYNDICDFLISWNKNCPTTAVLNYEKKRIRDFYISQEFFDRFSFYIKDLFNKNKYYNNLLSFFDDKDYIESNFIFFYENNFDKKFLEIIFSIGNLNDLNISNMQIKSFYKMYNKGNILNKDDILELVKKDEVLLNLQFLNSLSNEDKKYLFEKFDYDFLIQNQDFFNSYGSYILDFMYFLDLDFIHKNINNRLGFNNIVKLLDADLCFIKNLLSYNINLVEKIFELQNKTEVINFVQAIVKIKGNISKLQNFEEFFDPTYKKTVDKYVYEIKDYYENNKNDIFKTINNINKFNNYFDKIINSYNIENEYQNRSKIFKYQKDKLSDYLYIQNKFGKNSIKINTWKSFFENNENDYSILFSVLYKLAFRSNIDDINMNLLINKYFSNKYIFEEFILNYDFDDCNCLSDFLYSIDNHNTNNSIISNIYNILQNYEIDTHSIIENLDNINNGYYNFFQILSFLENRGLLKYIDSENNSNGGIWYYFENIMNNLNLEKLDIFFVNIKNINFLSNIINHNLIIKNFLSLYNIDFFIKSIDEEKINFLLDLFCSQNINQDLLNKNLSNISHNLFNFLFGINKYFSIDEIIEKNSNELQDNTVDYDNILKYFRKDLSSNDMVLILKKFGFEEDRQNSTSHRIMKHKENNATLPVPMGKKDICIGTLFSVFKRADSILNS
ncbi:type II toxin-antitoxin system HicA family toxin [Candidatus Vampirococcus lugosii]|uniref:HicA toxin of bacterial toxin-antitoxin n=1 Tax=Candidatus Vampirococcus lugosii TaxID=2789015 RepID=A0ABS5QKU3_9BACT|nr:type II toxin-antitoxin system HicA family toxin [Candidatus Vampirococcus lugosii]MBS8121847.1 putative HicA toxin of bacterial toxin-antitoxin [Candidatus Vampirococcus lugosii]